MTEGDKAFYKRRKREELNKARAAPSADLRRLHLGWAELYEARLNGEPKAKIQPMESALLRLEPRGKIQMVAVRQFQVGVAMPLRRSAA